MALLSVLILITISNVNGNCWMVELPKVNNICRATISCETTTEDMVDSVQNWGCIKTEAQYVDYNEERYHDSLESNYDLYMNFRKLNINISEDPLIQILSVSSKVKTLHIVEGNLVLPPIEIGSLVRLTELSLTYNKVETLNLQRVSVGVFMEHLNVSHNSISIIEDGEVENTEPSSITTIDISYNKLQSIPDNCFARFTQLNYLDLSHNSLKKLDIFTFEGIAQLQILKLSNNKISEIGQTFARLKKLKDLSLNYNQLWSLAEINFRTLINLEKLNLSSNLIENIDDRSLAANKNLKQLDLSNNNINIIKRMFFESNAHLHELSLFHNDIVHIDGGSFRLTNISFFNIQNNLISGSVDYDTFLGISVDTLDLSNGKLTKLGDKAFSSLSFDLRYLNLSSNFIENITVSSFQSLQQLLLLDLSYNNLTDVDFDTRDLVQVKEYYLQNNKIKKITRNMFKNMAKLVKLNLSHNKLVDIETNSFIELINLDELDISSNSFTQFLTANTFRGLYKVRDLNLSNTRLISCLNESFSGMVSAVNLNISNSLLETIEYDTFKATGAVKIIDLSNNSLKIFNINTSRIPKLKKLYLNNNKLNNIASRSFENFFFLEYLNLACNDIFHFDSSTLQSLPHLHHLSLYSNVNLQVQSDIFNNLVLSELSLKKVWQKFNFKNAVNTSISTLILSQCEIENFNSVFVQNIRNVLKLDISSNKIKELNRDSFLNMTDLNWLDISLNMISILNPGIFSSNYMINILNLNGNNIQSLPFGVLDGLRNLRILNLSNNKIHTFGINLLHASPSLNELLLENNNLTSMDFNGLSQTSVKLITIGGNSISCDALADWNKIHYISQLNITAESLDFNSENVLGIRCNTIISQKKFNEININITGEVTKIKETVGQLYKYLKISLNEMLYKLTTILESVSKDKVSPSLSGSEQSFNNDLKKLLLQLVNISEKVSNDDKFIISLIENNNNLTKEDNIYKEILSTQVFNKSIPGQQNCNAKKYGPILNFTQPLEVKLDKSTVTDIKVLLYSITVCLAIAILFGIITLTYKYLGNSCTRWVGDRPFYDRGQAMRNDLEME